MANVTTQTPTSSSVGSKQFSKIGSEISHYAGDLKSQVQSWVPEKMNVSETERSVSGVVGTALGVLAVERFYNGSFLAGGLALAGGAALLLRGISGKCPAYKAMGRDSSSEEASSKGNIPTKGNTSKAPFNTHASKIDAPMANRN